jgi:hypothetical protein
LSTVFQQYVQNTLNDSKVFTLSVRIPTRFGGGYIIIVVVVVITTIIIIIIIIIIIREFNL